MKIRCPNLVGFDAVSQTDRVCDQLIQVEYSPDLKRILCPRCRQEISLADYSLGKSNSESGGFRIPAKDRCSKCGGRYDQNGVCLTCGFLDPIKKAKRELDASDTLKTSGFQLWLKQIASEDVSLASIGYVLLACVCLLGFLMIVGGIWSLTVVGFMLAILGIILVVFSISVFRATTQITRDHSSSMGVLKPFWLLVLIVARKQNWQGYDPKLKGRVILDYRNNPIDDNQLMRLSDLTRAEVLDLENCSITDQGLQRLYGNLKLSCLVLRNTQVTPMAAMRLQQSNPKLWIWI